MTLKVYLLYTGGTIGCVGTPLAPMDGETFATAFDTFVTPMITTQLTDVGSVTIDYFTTTLDSTNMQPSNWVTIAQKIVTNFIAYDAFLVLHGTDTMAWTASALSFLLPGLGKPVIVTGSQLPLFYEPEDADAPTQLLYNTDALRNVLGAVEFLTFAVPEVCLYFDDTLYRGNRTVKSNASEFPAFSSPNYSSLGEYGVLAKLDDTLILPLPSAFNALENNTAVVEADLATIAANIDNQAVVDFLMFPAYASSDGTSSLLASMLAQLQTITDPMPVKGVIFEAFGEGNIPDVQAMQNQVKAMNEAGITMVDCTQVYQGDVNYTAYATGAWLSEYGVLSGRDMTPIAALTKLIVNLALGTEDLATVMGTSVAGELTPFDRISGYQNELLSAGESLYSINGDYQFENSTTGLLSLYDITGDTPVTLWSKDIEVPGRLVMRSNCNLVFFDENSVLRWTTGTQIEGTNAYLKVGDDGSLAIYDLYTNDVISTIYAPGTEG